MPIKFSFKKLPVDADGKAYDSLEDFQAAEIARILVNEPVDKAVQKTIVEHKDEIIEILEINFDSRPGARGQKRPRKPKTEPAQQPELPQ